MNKIQRINIIQPKKFLCLMIVIVISFSNLPLNFFSYTSSSDDLSLQQKEVMEYVVYSDGYRSFGSGYYPNDSVISFNITVLLISNSSVFFMYFVLDVWDPQPLNYTLAPGESTGEIDFKLISGRYNNAGLIDYNAIATIEDSNATIQWSYEVISLGKLSSIGFLFTFSTVGTVALVSVIFFKKRK